MKHYEMLQLAPVSTFHLAIKLISIYYSGLWIVLNFSAYIFVLFQIRKHLCLLLVLQYCSKKDKVQNFPKFSLCRTLFWLIELKSFCPVGSLFFLVDLTYLIYICIVSLIFFSSTVFFPCTVRLWNPLPAN